VEVATAPPGGRESAVFAGVVSAAALAVGVAGRALSRA
jgi:hypothetical protein